VYLRDFLDTVPGFSFCLELIRPTETKNLDIFVKVILDQFYPDLFSPLEKARIQQYVQHFKKT